MMYTVRVKPPRSLLMPRRQKDPMRPPTADERAQLEHRSRSHTAPAAQVARAKALLGVAAGHRFTEAAHAAGRRSGDAVAHVVARFNREGLAVLESGHGGGRPKRYTQTEQERILQEVRRTPDREQDRSATWSLSTLQEALRCAPDGLPGVSTYIIWCALHTAGFTWDKDRSWCETGAAVRKRKSGTVVVHDPDAGAKKT
jgi:transposase